MNIVQKVSNANLINWNWSPTERGGVDLKLRLEFGSQLWPPPKKKKMESNKLNLSSNSCSPACQKRLYKKG